MKADYSSKKESNETRYSVEYTMDIAVKAGQEHMPDGLSKVLELLDSALDVSDPNGTLEVSEHKIELKPGDKAMLIATYKNPQGLYEPKAITVIKDNASLTTIESGNNAIINIDSAGEYIVKAGEKEQKITVVKAKNINQENRQPKV